MTDWQIKSTPLKHQMDALEYLKQSRVAAFFMEMGTGKSLVAIMYAHLKRHKISRVLWCCPVSLKLNTRDEILKHTTCTESDVYVFNDKTTDDNYPPCFWYIAGLESLGASSRVFMAFNALVNENTLIIVDESSFIKGHRAKRTCRLLLTGQRSRYRIILNGTPITQGIEDLYTQMTFLSERILGYRSWYTFARKHLEYDPVHKGLITGRKAKDWLMAKIEPYVYQVARSECLDLPEKTHSSRTIPLTREQAALYEQCKDNAVSRLGQLEPDDIMFSLSVFMLFSDLQLIVNGIRPGSMGNGGSLIKNNKNKELITLLGGISPEHPVIIWIRYLKSIEAVCQVISGNFPEKNISRYYGGLNEKQRRAELNRWRQRGGYLVATSSCGGFGLTLTEAKYAVYYTSGFKYSERVQSEDRIHRIGQNSRVHYISLWTDSGIDGRIQYALMNKRDALNDFKSRLNDLKKQGKSAVIDYLKGI